MGKGSNPRPFDVPKKQFDDNWEQTFGKKKKQEPSEKQPGNK